ncbi:MAG: M48 family metalloprotease [Algoriphagus sp.]|nr:M48 family metalloprotease [Algoriphagus sp.]
MQRIQVFPSAEFKQHTTRAMLSIGWFFIVYTAMVLLGFLIFLVCVGIGLAAVVNFFNIPILFLAIGLASMGFFVLYFLLKFLFVRRKIDRSHLLPIDLSQEPRLREMLEEVVQKIGTKMPKSVYLSNEVNASVFYDSSFLSMFLPIRKNLQIGMGLVNVLSEEQFKAVMAHEFGHFAQRSMKLGSYVYYVNKTIYNLLYENDTYSNLATRWANASGYFYIFVVAAMKLVQACQWVLRKLYDVVNMRYLALSRQMEFNADEVAARVVGYLPMVKSFRAISRADIALQEVFRLSNTLIASRFRTKNVYQNQLEVIRFQDEQYLLKFGGGDSDADQDTFPSIGSRLTLQDQWASHPTDDERIVRLISLEGAEGSDSTRPALGFFRNPMALQEQATALLFSGVSFPDGEVTLDTGEFDRLYQKDYLKDTLPSVFRGYYDYHLPEPFDLDQETELGQEKGIEEFFSLHQVSNTYEVVSIRMDIQTLDSLTDPNSSIRTFDYSGKKYQKEDAFEIKVALQSELERLQALIAENDRNIFEYFLHQEKIKGLPALLKEYYQDFFSTKGEKETLQKQLNNLQNQLEFTNQNTPFKIILENFRRLAPEEEELKNQIRKILDDQRLESLITEEMRGNFIRYVGEKLVYFQGERYQDEQLGVLLRTLEDMRNLSGQLHWQKIYGLLSYQASLVQTPAIPTQALSGI